MEAGAEALRIISQVTRSKTLLSRSETLLSEARTKRSDISNKVLLDKFSIELQRVNELNKHIFDVIDPDRNNAEVTEVLIVVSLHLSSDLAPLLDKLTFWLERFSQSPGRPFKSHTRLLLWNDDGERLLDLIQIACLQLEDLLNRSQLRTASSNLADRLQFISERLTLSDGTLDLDEEFEKRKIIEWLAPVRLDQVEDPISLQNKIDTLAGFSENTVYRKWESQIGETMVCFGTRKSLPPLVYLEAKLVFAAGTGKTVLWYVTKCPRKDVG